MARRSADILFIINVTFIVTIFCLGLRPGAFLPDPDKLTISNYHNQAVSFLGQVCREADVSLFNRRLTICAGSSRILVTTSLYPVYDYGDWLEVKGLVQNPPVMEDFDYEAYLARYDIYSVMYYPNLSRVEGKLSGFQRLYSYLLFCKQNIKKLIAKYLPEPEAGLASAILLGYRRSVIREDLDIFARSGLSHLIAISGAHIAILSALLVNLLLAVGLKRRQAVFSTIIFLCLYPVLTGLSASAVRSSIMGGLALIASLVGRPSSIIRAVVLVATLMLVFNPRLLRNDVGFQMSFLSLLGLIYIHPQFLSWFNKKLGGLSIVSLFLNGVSLTLSAQLAILPISLANFKQLSLISPVANILVVWAFAPLLVCLVMAIVASSIFPVGGLWWFFPAHLLLKFIFFIAQFLATPTWAAKEISGFGWLEGIIYYSVLILWLLRRRLTSIFFLRQTKNPPIRKGFS